MMYPFTMHLAGAPRCCIAYFLSDHSLDLHRDPDWFIERIEVYDEEDIVELPKGSEPYKQALARLAALGREISKQQLIAHRLP